MPPLASKSLSQFPAPTPAMPSLPRVTVCTPTFNRRPFFPAIIKCMDRQTYPRDLIEWLVYDDGTDPVGDLLDGVEGVVYHRHPGAKLTIGDKRHRMMELATGDILVHMDDDDYYPPTRIAHVVEVLSLRPDCDVALPLEMFYMYSVGREALYEVKCNAPVDVPAAAFAMRASTKCRFSATSAIGEEHMFLEGLQTDIAPLDPAQTVVLMHHESNSADKRVLFMATNGRPASLSRRSLLDLVGDPEQASSYSQPRALYVPGMLANKPDILQAGLVAAHMWHDPTRKTRAAWTTRNSNDASTSRHPASPPKGPAVPHAQRRAAGQSSPRRKHGSTARHSEASQ
jgi:hypothetical protein